MSPTLQFQTLTTAVLTDEERISGTLSPENAALAIHALHVDGIVCLENAVDLDHVAILREKLNSEVEVLRKMRGTHYVNNSEDGRDTGNMSQAPPLDPALMFGDIWANGPALAAMSGVIGPSPRVVWVGGNTLLGSYDVSRQNVHADIIFNHATFPFACATNYYLSDVSEGYGSTEVWLGSHRDTTFSDHLDEEKMVEEGKFPAKFGIKYELLEDRRKWAPPIYPTVKKGSVIVRDLRLWHAGVPSKSTEFRIMLGFVYTAWWYKCPTPVVFPDSARGLVDQWAKQEHPVVYNAYFASPEVDHKTIAFTPSFDSSNKAYRSILPAVA